jgi:hypothetical protein
MSGPDKANDVGLSAVEVRLAQSGSPPVWRFQWTMNGRCSAGHCAARAWVRCAVIPHPARSWSVWAVAGMTVAHGGLPAAMVRLGA